MSGESDAETSSRHQKEVIFGKYEDKDYGICDGSDTDYIDEDDEDQHYSRKRASLILKMFLMELIVTYGLVMLSLPSHCSHKLQPLDRSVFGPFKRNLACGQDGWMRSNPGKTMAIYDIPGIVKESWLKSATPVNIVHGFSASSVFPFNRSVLCEDEFASSSVIDRPDPNCKVFASNVSKAADRQGEEI